MYTFEEIYEHVNVFLTAAADTCRLTLCYIVTFSTRRVTSQGIIKDRND